MAADVEEDDNIANLIETVATAIDIENCKNDPDMEPNGDYKFSINRLNKPEINIQAKLDAEGKISEATKDNILKGLKQKATERDFDGNGIVTKMEALVHAKFPKDKAETVLQNLSAALKEKGVEEAEIGKLSGMIAKAKEDKDLSIAESIAMSNLMGSHGIRLSRALEIEPVNVPQANPKPQLGK